MTTLRLLLRLFRELPSLIALRLDRYNMAAHNPEFIEGQHWCLRCQVPAPCPEWMGAAERTAAIKEQTRP